MDCPRCSVELGEIKQDESTMNRCAECGGLWIDVTDLNKVLLHANLPALASISGTVNPDEITGMCPACNVEMVVVEGGEKKDLAYDTCESCGGIFVDGDEDEPPESISWSAAEAQLVSFFKAFSRKK
jgi:Zn-finger nucleic acid-binding protein